MEFRITLDREAFKVLASDTRLDILKALDERPMTVSELGRKLELNKATVFEHLEKLVGAGLVKKQDDEDRMWVYYSLSWKARRILHPERVTIALLFSTALGALLSGITVAAEYARKLSPGLSEKAAGPLMQPYDASRDAAQGSEPASEPGAQPAAEPSAAPAPPSPEQAADPAGGGGLPEAAAAAAGAEGLLLLAAALFLTVAVLMGIGLWYWRQARLRDAREAAGAGRAAKP